MKGSRHELSHVTLWWTCCAVCTDQGFRSKYKKSHATSASTIWVRGRRLRASQMAPKLVQRTKRLAYQRLPQLLRHPPPPRTSWMISNNISAPMVALIIAATIPKPRWIPS